RRSCSGYRHLTQIIIDRAAWASYPALSTPLLLVERHFCMDLRKVALAAAAAVVFVFATPAAFPAISIPTATPYTQNFDGMGVPVTATTQSSLPGDFRADAPSVVRTIGTFATAGVTTARGGGANLSTSAAN